MKLKGEITTKKLLLRILKAVQMLEGKLCWQVKLSYGGAYNFDFGRKIQFSKSALGESFIMTEGTSFLVKNNKNAVLVDTKNTNKTDTQIVSWLEKNIVGNKINSIDVSYNTLSLSICFSNHLCIIITPDDEDDLCELPYWTVKYSENHFLSVGPKRIFHFKTK